SRSDAACVVLEEEGKGADSLRENLATGLWAQTSPPPIWVIAVGAYSPLHQIPAATLLCQRSWPDPVVALIALQVREPEQERELRATLPRLTPIKDPMSVLVRDQYEEDPYPRCAQPRLAAATLAIDNSLA